MFGTYSTWWRASHTIIERAKFAPFFPWPRVYILSDLTLSFFHHFPSPSSKTLVALRQTWKFNLCPPEGSACACLHDNKHVNVDTLKQHTKCILSILFCFIPLDILWRINSKSLHLPASIQFFTYPCCDLMLAINVVNLMPLYIEVYIHMVYIYKELTAYILVSILRHFRYFEIWLRILSRVEGQSHFLNWLPTHKDFMGRRRGLVWVIYNIKVYIS